MSYGNGRNDGQVGGEVPTSGVELGARFSVVVDLYKMKADAAKVAKTSAEMLQRYARGTHKIPLQVAGRLCSAKGVSLDWLWTGQGAMLAADRLPTIEAQYGDPMLDEALLGNLVQGLEQFLEANELDVPPEDHGRLVVLLYRMLARRRTELRRSDVPIPDVLCRAGHPFDFEEDQDLGDLVRLVG